MFNQASLIGYVGGDPEVKYLQNGNAVVNFSLATSERWKDKQTGEKKEETQWHRCVAFGKIAEIIGEYVTKGKPIHVTGRIKYSKYTDKEGIERYSTQINVDNMTMLPSRDGGGERTENSSRPASQNSRPAASGPQGGVEDDDIPF